MKTTPWTRGSATKAAPTSPAPGMSWSTSVRDASLMQRAHRFGGDERRLLGGFGDDRIARRERGGDLAGEDRQRKVPGTDADDEAQRGRGAGK